MNKILLLLSMVIVLAGCDDNSKVRIISDLEKETVFIDGDKNGSIRVGYKTVMLPVGEHTVLVEKLSKNGEWLYRAQENFKVAPEVITYVNLVTKKIATEKRIARLAKEEQLRKDRAAKRAYKNKIAAEKLWKSKEIFVDKVTLSVWEDSKHTVQKIKWYDAEKYCKNLKFSGSSNWRLPIREELKALYARQKELKFVVKGTYWSTSANKYHAYNIHFSDGRSKYTYGKATREYMRCIRM